MQTNMDAWLNDVKRILGYVGVDLAECASGKRDLEAIDKKLMDEA